MTSYESDAHEHMRKEEYDQVFTSRKRTPTTSLGPRRTVVSGRGGVIDYYDYYPLCIRALLPQKRTGNMIVLYENDNQIIVSCGPHWPGVIVVGKTH